MRIFAIILKSQHFEKSDEYILEKLNNSKLFRIDKVKVYQNVNKHDVQESVLGEKLIKNRNMILPNLKSQQRLEFAKFVRSFDDLRKK